MNLDENINNVLQNKKHINFSSYERLRDGFATMSW